MTTGTWRRRSCRSPLYPTRYHNFVVRSLLMVHDGSISHDICDLHFLIFTMMFYCLAWWYLLVIWHGWLENPRTKWRFIAGNIIDLNEGFSIATLNSQRVYCINIFSWVEIDVILHSTFFFKEELVLVFFFGWVFESFWGRSLNRTHAIYILWLGMVYP